MCFGFALLTPIPPIVLLKGIYGSVFLRNFRIVSDIGFIFFLINGLQEARSEPVHHVECRLVASSCSLHMLDRVQCKGLRIAQLPLVYGYDGETIAVSLYHASCTLGVSSIDERRNIDAASAQRAAIKACLPGADARV